MKNAKLPGLLLALLGSPLLSAAAPEDLDACQLLTSGQVATIQGESPVRFKGSHHPEGEVTRSQCFWTLPTHTRSVSLEVTHGDPAAVRARWAHFFHGADGPKAGGKTGAPRPVSGLGEEAFWAGNAEVGGLYVLAGDSFLRLAVGGGDEDEERIERTSALARHVLAGLSGGREPRP